MKPVKSMRGVIGLRQERVSTDSPTLLIALDKVKNVNTFPIMKIRQNDLERIVNDGTTH